MPLSPTSRPKVDFFTSAMLLFSGSFGGIHLTTMVAPYSEWSRLVGFLMFPMAFMASMQLWPRGNGLVAKALGYATPTKDSKTIPMIYQRLVGFITFVLTSIFMVSLSGLILTPPAMQIVIDPGYKILIPAGASYGVICWGLIHLGFWRQTNIYRGK